MTWKTGDTVAIPVYFETTAGVPTVYANLAAFTSAVGAFTFYQGGAAISSPPTPTLTPQASTGWHHLSFVLPAGVDTILITKPSGIIANPDAYLLITPNADTDAVAATLAGTVGTPVAGSTFTVNDFTTIEGDNRIVQEFTIPVASLVVLDATIGKYQYTDLSDISGVAWTIAAQARGPWNQLPGATVDFSYAAAITDKVLCKVAIGWTSVPAGAVVKNSDGTTDSTGVIPATTYLFDVQLVPPVGSTYATAKLTVIVGTHTIRRQQTTTP